MSALANVGQDVRVISGNASTGGSVYKGTVIYDLSPAPQPAGYTEEEDGT